MKRTKKEKGITLIALIITIVVLLILAVVAINTVTGDGIIQHATNAKTQYQNAQAVENSVIASYEQYLYDNDITRDKLIKFYVEISAYGDYIECTAEEGMTWKEFLASSYNTTFYNYTYDEELVLEFTFEESDGMVLIKDLDNNGGIKCNITESDGKTVSTDTLIVDGRTWMSDSQYL